MMDEHRTWRIFRGVAVLAACLAIAGTAEARLRETEKECDARYGKPVRVERTKQRLVKEYELDDYNVHVIMARESHWFFFHRYHATAIKVTRRGGAGDKNQPLDKKAIEEVLRANAGRSGWEEVNATIEAARRTSLDDQSHILNDARMRTRWTRRDGAMASYDRRTGELILRVGSKDRHTRQSSGGAVGF